MIGLDVSNLYLDDCKEVAEFPLGNSAMYKASVDVFNKIDQQSNSTPTRLKDFVFPRPPQVQSIRPVSTSSVCNGTSDSDTQSDSDCRCRPRTRPKRSSPITIHTASGSFNTTPQETLTSSSPMTFATSLPSFLPPIGVFWDIENCNVPKGCSAVLVAQVIRDSFFDGYREAEFLVVCDVTKEPGKLIDELNDAQVNLIHVPSLHKNAADEKLRQSMRRFADIHGSPATVVLITGDINFISDVSDLRHRRKIHVILLHQDNTSESLILCANESHNILRLFEALPPRETKPGADPHQLTVYNLPLPSEPARIKSRLKRISDNCGGRVVEVLHTGSATIVFSTKDLAQRAQKRMSGADVFGNKISVSAPRRYAATPLKNGTSTLVLEEQRTMLSTNAAPQQQQQKQQLVSATHFTTTSSIYTAQYGASPKLNGPSPKQNGMWVEKRQAGGQNALHFQKSLPGLTLTSCPSARVKIVDVPDDCPSENIDVLNMDKCSDEGPGETSSIPVVNHYPNLPQNGIYNVPSHNVTCFNELPDNISNGPIVSQYLNVPPNETRNFHSIVKPFGERLDETGRGNVPDGHFGVPPSNVNRYFTDYPNRSAFIPAINPQYGNVLHIDNMNGLPPNVSQYPKMQPNGTGHVPTVSKYGHILQIGNANVPPPNLNQCYQVHPNGTINKYQDILHTGNISVLPPKINQYYKVGPNGTTIVSNGNQHLNISPRFFRGQVPPPAINPNLHAPPTGTANVQYLNAARIRGRSRPPQYANFYAHLNANEPVNVPGMHTRMYTLPTNTDPDVQVTPGSNGTIQGLNQHIQVANGHDSGTANYAWKKPTQNGRTVKNERENVAEKFRPIFRLQQDNDTASMPPPIPTSNKTIFSNIPTYQIPVLVGRRVSPHASGGGWKGDKGAMAVPQGSSSPYSLTSDEGERFFHPIQTPKMEAIDLQVTNLDQSMETKDMKKVLLALFTEHVMVLHVSMYVQSDGNLAAHVRVPSLADAQFAISQLHRRKVGFKRILIAYANTGGPSPQLIRSQIVSLLVEIPGHRLPLFKFCELFESRYLTSISVSDMYKLKDVCLISEEKGGRMICLNPDHRHTPSPAFNWSHELPELPYCTLHTNGPGPERGWAEQGVDVLPNVRISLNVLACRIHVMIQSHKGCLPLPSLPRCYEVQFHPLEVDDTGVPLEHLISCLPNVEIYQGVGCVKYLRWVDDKGGADDPVKCASPALAPQLEVFSRELIEMMKLMPHCQLMFNRFIPAYHHHFGRQCRVADYGFTKLIVLLEALPHIVQVLGEGTKRIVTLSHRAQVRRFTSDMMRVLKTQASKQVLLSEFATAFQRVIKKEWDVVDYGVCDIADLLRAVSQSSVVVTHLENDVLVAFPKREQTPSEVCRTQKFAEDLHNDDGVEGERRVSLTPTEGLKVLASQVTMIIEASGSGEILLTDVPSTFKNMFGFALKPHAYGCTSVRQLMQLMGDKFTVTDSGRAGPTVQLCRYNHNGVTASATANVEGMKVWRVLLEAGASVMRLTVEQFISAYWCCHQVVVSVDHLADFPDIVQVSFAGGVPFVHLTAVMSLAADLYRLLFSAAGGCLPLDSLSFEFCRKYGRSIEPVIYGHPSLESLLAAMADVVVVVAAAAGQKVIAINENLRQVGTKMPDAKMPDAKMPDAIVPEAIVPEAIVPEAIVPDAKMSTDLGLPSLDSPNAFLSNLIHSGLPMFKMEPPKPDTPSKRALAVDLPQCQGEVDGHLSSKLYSPAAGLLCAHTNRALGGYVPLNIVPPLASQLPMPTGFTAATRQLFKDGDDVAPANGEHSLTNGNDSHGDTSLDMNSSGNSTPTRVRRKKRLAANFTTPLES